MTTAKQNCLQMVKFRVSKFKFVKTIPLFREYFLLGIESMNLQRDIKILFINLSRSWQICEWAKFMVGEKVSHQKFS